MLAYGQTGSGKTYSMLGTADDPGMMERAGTDLFARAEKRAAMHDSATHDPSAAAEAEAAAEAGSGSAPRSAFSASYVEIYNEKVCPIKKRRKMPFST